MENSADFYVPWAQLRANRPVAQRLERSAVRSAAPAFQNGLRIGIGIDRQCDRQATTAFANELECFAVHGMKYSICSIRWTSGMEHVSPRHNGLPADHRLSGFELAKIAR